MKKRNHQIIESFGALLQTLDLAIQLRLVRRNGHRSLSGFSTLQLQRHPQSFPKWIGSLDSSFATLLVALITFSLIAFVPCARGQAKISSPPSNSPLSYPTFTLAWQNVGAAQYFLCLGSQTGADNYYGSSVGTATTITLNWMGTRPAGCWVRLWSLINVYSGSSNSTVAYRYWAFNDTYYPLAQLGQTGGNGASARNMLIDGYVNGTLAFTGKYGGECKAFLQSQFSVAAQAYKLPNGATPLMPANLTSEGVGINNWQWQYSSSSGFTQIGAVNPNQSTNTKRTALYTLIRSTRKGDVLQMVMLQSVLKSGMNITDYVPHTLLFTNDYVSDATVLQWVDSNMDNRGTVGSGSLWPWGAPKTIDSLVGYLASTYGGATLYRLRDDISHR